MVACPSLYLVHLLHNSTDTGELCTAAIRSPVSNVELTQLVDFASLERERGGGGGREGGREGEEGQ